MMVLVLPLEEAGDNGIKLLVLREAASASASAWLLPPALSPQVFAMLSFSIRPTEKYPIICSPQMWRNPIFSTIIVI